MARRIVISSGKGGVGKSTVCANLGRSLAFLGQRVVLIDVDFGLNNLDVIMGLEDKVIYDINDVITGRCRLNQALVQDKIRKNLYVLPSNSIKYGNQITAQNIKIIVESLSKVFDYVLIDSPAGIDFGFHRAVGSAEEGIVVVNPSLPSLRDADKVLTVLKSYKLKKTFLIVNRARGDLIINNNSVSPLDIADILKTDLLGVLPEEDAVFLSCGSELPYRCPSFKAYKILANNLHNGKVKLFDVTKKYLGFFGSIRRSLKKSI